MIRFRTKFIIILVALVVFSLGIHMFYVEHVHPGEHEPAVQAALQEVRKLLLLLFISVLIFRTCPVFSLETLTQVKSYIYPLLLGIIPQPLQEAFSKGILNPKLCD